VVEHLHPLAGKAAWDATYVKTRSRFGDDHQVWASREHLWSKNAGTREGLDRRSP
jgi:hypothetical protein